MTGNDEPVSSYVMSFEESRTFLKKLVDMLEFLIPHYIKEGKNSLVISIGCTGGKHRSVSPYECPLQCPWKGWTHPPSQA